MQYVGVRFRSGPDRVYSYEWEGETELKYGMRVWVPENFANPMPSLADVVTVYPNREAIAYKGKLSRIMGVDEDG